MPLLIQMLARFTEHAVPRMTDRTAVPLAYTPILILIYSVSFVLGQCVRGALHAAILAVGAMALIFVIPLVIAPLSWLSVEMVERADVGALDAYSCIAFVSTMAALSGALLGLAAVLFKRNVQVEVDRRTLGWSVAAILLVLAAGVAFPMGTNLPARQVIPLAMSQKCVIYDMAADGNDVLVLISDAPAWWASKLGLVRVHIGEQTSVADEPVWFADPGRERTFYYQGLDLAWPAEDRSLAYVAVRQSVLENWTPKESTSVLYTIALDGKQTNPVVHRVELNPLLAAQLGRATVCLRQRRLYVYSDERPKERLLTFSIADLRAPSLIQSHDLTPRIGWLDHGPSQQDQIRLAPIPDLDDSTRLGITHELAARSWVPAGDGRILASDLRSGSFIPLLVLYEAGQTQDDVTALHPITQRRGTPFEGLLGLSHGALFRSDHLVYRLAGSGATVYRIDNSRQIERIGHYAADGGIRAMVSLPGNRVVLASNRLHVLDLSERLRSPAR